MKALSSLGLIAALLSLPAAAAADSFREEFDQPGGDVAASRFSLLVLTTNGGIAREPLTAGQGAPSTGGVLPIDEGGDSELRYFEVVSPAAVSSYALTPEQGFADVAMDGYLAIGFTDAFGARSAAFVLRATGSTIPTVNAYRAGFLHNFTDARLNVSRIIDGVGQPAMASSDLFPVDPDVENYRLRFRAEGDRLTAELWRAVSIDGELVETPVDLDAGTAGIQNSLSAVDGNLTSGAVGIQAFTRSTNSVFFDDLEVTDTVFDDGFESGDTAAWSATSP